MIQVTLMGGLANQVFQYAAALSVVGPGNEDQIIADCSWLDAHSNSPGITPRPFQLGAIGVDPRRDDGRPMPSYYEDRPWDYDPAKYYHLRGYFQDLKYWAPWVREWFRERIPKFKRRHKVGAIHVRRGDYVSNLSATAWHGVTPLEYFVETCYNHDGDEGVDRFLIFSDDPAWCADYLVPALNTPAEIVVGNTAWEDIAEIASCDFHVISNSTFGWLGAYLADSKGVVYPKNWLTNNKPAPPIFPSFWLAR